MFLKIIIAAIAIWVAFSVIGFIVHAAVVLAIIGGVAFLGTAAYGAIKNSKKRNQIS
ncbi:MAG TPA: hypothetical protein VHX38_15520 [Pseudonocardiaceae bacterium]|jgi:hypothetical protein|nr:hypothetical protein [Pseudonocardiaceae bacterium]